MKKILLMLGLCEIFFIFVVKIDNLWNKFSFSFPDPWAMVFPSFTRGIPKMTTLGSTWLQAKGFRNLYGESREASRKVFAELFSKSDLLAPAGASRQIKIYTTALNQNLQSNLIPQPPDERSCWRRRP